MDPALTYDTCHSFYLLHEQERKADVAAAVQEKLMSAICGVSDDANLRQSMLELLIAGTILLLKYRA